MLFRAIALSVFLLSCTTAAQQQPLATDADIAAAQNAPLGEAWAGWNDPFQPFNVIGDIYYVGPERVSAYLITTPQGHILIDGDLPQSPPLIIANMRALGFDIHDVKYLLNTHAHIDHAGGLAALQPISGATMV